MSEEEYELDWGIELKPKGKDKIQAEGYLVLPKDRGKVSFTINLDFKEFSAILAAVHEEIETVIAQIGEKLAKEKTAD